MSAVAAKIGRVSPYAIFRNRDFSLLWSSQLVSELGSSITTLASGIYVYKISGSVVDLSLMMIVSVAPSLLVGLFAGVFVDRYDRQRIMIITSLLRGALVLAIPFLIPYNLAWMYVLVFLSGTVGQFFNPAQASVLPDLASEEELSSANSLMAISTYGSLVIGYGLAGLFVDRFPIEWAFYIDALTFLVCALLMGLMHIPAVKPEEQTSARVVMRNLTDGAKFILATPILRSLFLLFTLVFLNFGFLNALRLPFTIQVLNASSSAYGMLEGLTLIGFVVASLLMAQWGDRLREGQWLAISFIAMGITSIAFALSSTISVAFVIIIVEGFVNAPSVIARALVIQRNAPREMRGRVFGNFFVMRDAMFMLGIAVAGLADIFDVRILFLLASLYGLVVGLIALVLPGLGQPAEEWRKIVHLLRSAPQAPGLDVGTTLAAGDFARLVSFFPALGRLEAEKQEHLRQQMIRYDVPSGNVVVRQNEFSDAAYFILEGQVVVGIDRDDISHIMSVLREGDFFGEIAALKGVPRTANVVAQEATQLVKMPAETLKEMAEEPELHSLFTTRMEERLRMNSMIDRPRGAGINPEVLRELRTVSD
jgi:MFS family permease